MRRLFTIISAMAMLVGMLALPATADTTRHAVCEAAGGTYAQPGPTANQDTCTVLGEVTTVPVGDRVEVGRGDEVPVGEPTEVHRATGDPVQVNSPNARQAVFHIITTITYEQATEVEVTYEQATEVHQQVTVYSFQPAGPVEDSLVTPVTSNLVVGAGEPIISYDTVAGDPITTTETSVEVSNPGTRR
jgi:hypothetical protein